ncbi:MAG: cbb3-type cytochrome c oxidase subunit II, partial [Methylophilaceae bacterium]
MKHDNIERNVGILLVLTMLAISVGGMVEIVPLFFIKETVEKVEGVRPYSPLEL